MSTVEIETRSGYVKGRRSILTAARKAAANAIINAALQTVQETILSVAQNTGAMRVAFAKSIERSSFRFTVAQKRFVIKGTEVLKLMESTGKSIAPYLPHHIRQSSEFNTDFAGGYKNPSTAGTRPIDMNEVMIAYAHNVRENIKKELLKEGLKIR